MAIDSESKRRSAISPGLPFLRPLPRPDGTIDAGDRAHLAGLYSGFGLPGVSAPTVHYYGTGLYFATLHYYGELAWIGQHSHDNEELAGSVSYTFPFGGTSAMGEAVMGEAIAGEGEGYEWVSALFVNESASTPSYVNG